jgi:hypothetical protein
MVRQCQPLVRRITRIAIAIPRTQGDVPTSASKVRVKSHAFPTLKRNDGRNRSQLEEFHLPPDGMALHSICTNHCDALTSFSPTLFAHPDKHRQQNGKQSTTVWRSTRQFKVSRPWKVCVWFAVWCQRTRVLRELECT